MSYFLSLIPALLMWEYVSVKVNLRLDRKTRKRLFRIGFLTALAAGALEYPLDGVVAPLAFAPLTGLALKAILVGVIEEGTNFVGLLFLADRKQISAIGPAAAIPLAAGIGIGFALFENMFYLGAAALHGTVMSTALMRAFTAIPGHALDGMAMGAFYCLAWRSPRRFDPAAALAAWVVPAVMHALYDFTAFAMALPDQARWASYLFPFVLLTEGLLTAALVAAALRGATWTGADMSEADAPDEIGNRAVAMAVVLLLGGNGLLYLAVRATHPAAFAAIAAAPLVLGVDLALVGMRRRALA